ncbi:Dimethyladenosine transferase 1, mitochondrial [Trachymyrmex zeteki]|uniref:rRNA adenine N(6)-methyltransferase n=1 Tax=Mycetomoellerius zeteki TaxID=64791 RepID=A0A151X248_9HYME|nr:PREDICTED: dimethyladenosine transferase 1, mitochondrial [Trachymyrmex zeteki]KYQ54336.1 Dimethyladenosine transferase 1, mitochondrial [Trachymyrmex zeteki]
MSAPRLPPLPVIRDILKLYNLSAIKRLSQNFLLDQNITNKIVAKAGKISGAEVLEVGPGPGGLTQSILRQVPERLIVVEKDKRFKPTLEMLADSFGAINGKMDIMYDDILKTNMESLFSLEKKRNWNDKPPDIFVIGNLPFNLATHLIIKWLHAISEQRGLWAFGRTKMTLTFQKEVAERLVAQPLENQRCRLSVMAQTWTFPVLRFIIPGKAFVPKPDVDVGVVSFTPLVKPRTQHDFKFFEMITRHVFSFRQKYSVRCIETLFPKELRKDLGLMMYKLADLDPTLRPTQLTIEDINRLATAYKYLLEKHPELKLYNYRSSRHLLPLNDTKNVVVQDCAEMLEENVGMSI